MLLISCSYTKETKLIEYSSLYDGTNRPTVYNVMNVMKHFAQLLKKNPNCIKEFKITVIALFGFICNFNHSMALLFEVITCSLVLIVIVFVKINVSPMNYAILKNVLRLL